MSQYKTGTVAKATVRCVPDVIVMRDDAGWWVSPIAFEGDRCHGSDVVTDIRPLVLLDLEDPAAVVAALRGAVSPWECLELVADQIEAQTKPPRIPEPGMWGVVEATNGDAGGKRIWVRWPENSAGNGWVSDTGYWRCWSDLIDPTLVREGVES